MHAQEANYDVTVSPVFFDLSANPGGTINDKIRIRNNTTSPLPIKLTVKKLSGDLNGEITLKNDDSDNTTTWIKFNEDSFVANPLEWTDVPFSIDIPENAAYGYYFAISFEQDDTSPLARTGAKITGAAAVPILLNVRKEGAKIEGKLDVFKTDSDYYEYPPINFSTTFVNTGNLHIRPHGTIFIKDWLGRQVAELNVNGAQGSVLPNSKRVFENTWNDGFITYEPKMEYDQVKRDENGKVEKELKFHFDKILDLRVGRYTATAIMVISTSEKDIPFQSQVSFFVFPWKVLIAILLFVVFAGLGFYSTMRNIIRRVLSLFGRGKQTKKEQDE